MGLIKLLFALLCVVVSALPSGAQMFPAPGVAIRDEGTSKGRATSFNFIGTGGVCEVVSGVAECTWNGVGTGLGEPGGDGIVVRSGVGNTVARTLTGTTGNLVCTNGSGVAGNPTCDVGSTIVQTDQANTYTTGLQNFNAATVNLPATFSMNSVALLPTVAELNFVDGVTSAIQAQIDGKAPIASPTFTGILTTPAITLGATAITSTGVELNYTDGVTSAIQAQIDLKAPLNSPTLVTPTIASFTNATHTHQNSAGGGTLTEAALATTDVTTNNATTDKHGLLTKLSGVSTEFLNGLGVFATPAGGGGGGAPDAHATTHKHGGTDEVATATPTANAIPKAGVGGTLGDGWLAAAITRDAEIDSFGELVTFAGITGTCDDTSYVRGDGTCSVPTGAGDLSSNTATSVDSEVALFSSTTGKLVKRATGTGIARLTSGVLSVSEASGDIVSSGTNAMTIQQNAVALSEDTTGNYVNDVLGTINEIIVTHTPSEGSTATISLPTGIAATKIGGGGVDSTEFGYLGSVTSDIQTQINLKAPLASPTFTGILTTPAITLGAIALTPTGTELNFVDGVTSAIQAQIDGKQIKTMTSADCSSEDIPAGGYCINTGTPWTTYKCPFASSVCDDPGESKPELTVADIPAPQSLNDAATHGRFILGANSEANATIPACIDNNADNDCTDAGDAGVKMFIDPVNGFTMKAYPDGHLSDVIPSTFAKIVTGSAGEMERLTSAGVHTYTNVKPLKSVEPMGHAFGGCSYNEGTLNTSKPITGYFVCTDADADGFDFDWIAPDSWDAGTLTVEIAALSTNATPSGNLVMSCSGQAVRSADTIANRATTGEQTASMTFATTSKEQHGTTAAITLQGTAAAGAHIYMHCDVDATLTTTTQMADVKIIATPKIEYAIGSRSDG